MSANGRAQTFAVGEQWCWDVVSSCPVTGSYQALWAREFRYDGARTRYMNRPLNPVTFTPLTTPPTVWSDYDGDEIYGDFTVGTGNPPPVTNPNSYEPGLWRSVAGAADYLHNDHLGTLRTTSGTTGSGGASRVFTAFGEKISGDPDRFGYVGAFGYQAHSIAESTNPDGAFPYLHVGARYYDPSSGRFLQRDPIGVRSVFNVYLYAVGSPLLFIDPSGLQVDDAIVVPPPDMCLGPGCGRPVRPPPPPQSPEEIAEELRRERLTQVVVGTCIGAVGLGVGLVGGLVGGLVAGAAFVIDVGAAIYANNDPIVVPTNAPKTGPSRPAG